MAIKVLPDEFAHDAERLARFEREAQMLASLNHPNIATIYGLEESDGKRFIVMELVEGETLAHRLLKGPLPVDEALEVCRQIAEGLEAAHEKGVIHRDLKPGNVMITADDKVKILDFGLAKALAGDSRLPDATHSPTITEAMTRPGVILGTAAYMSPGTGAGEARRQAGRHLGLRLHPLRVPDGQAGIRGGEHYRDAGLDPQRGAGLAGASRCHSFEALGSAASVPAERSQGAPTRHCRCPDRDAGTDDPAERAASRVTTSPASVG